MFRFLIPVVATLSMLVGCAAETDPEPVHVRSAEETKEGGELGLQLKCRSGKAPTPMTCCDASDGCVRKYRCWACDVGVD